jgi:hypothetical protein
LDPTFNVRVWSTKTVSVPDVVESPVTELWVFESMNKEFRERQFEKARAPMVLMFGGIDAAVREEHPAKASAGIDGRVSGRDSVAAFAHPEKAASPSEVTPVAPNSMFARIAQSLKAFFSMVTRVAAGAKPRGYIVIA